MEKLFLDRRFLVNGQKSHIHLDNYVRLCLVPEDGLGCQILGKSSTRKCDYEWKYLDDILTANNGLTYTRDCPNLLQLGGDLIKDTTITGNNTYDLSLIGLDQFFLGIDQTFSGTGVGAILQRINISNESEWTQYNLPLTAGTNGQTLITDGSGNVTWGNTASLITNADNGLNLNGTVVELGGTLIKSTTIQGADFPLSFFNINTFQLEANNIASIQASVTRLVAGTQLLFSTHDLGSKFDGAILQLIDNSNGEVEYTPFRIPLVDGAVNQILQTNGAGLVSWVNLPGGGITLADNGLNLSGSTVKLGGALLQNTTVSGSTFDMNFGIINLFKVHALNSIELRDDSDTRTENRGHSLVAYKSGSLIGAIKQEEIVTIQVFDWDEVVTGTRYKLFPIPPSMRTTMNAVDFTVSTMTDTLAIPGRQFSVRVETNTGVSGSTYTHTVGTATYGLGPGLTLGNPNEKLRIKVIDTWT